MEKPGFYDQLSDLKEVFGADTKQISLNKASKYMGMDARTLKASKGFPVKKIGKSYSVNLINLARWLAG